MPRARDLGIAIGALPTGPTNSVLDVEGVGLGHATITRETARTGVTCLLLAEDAYPRPLVGGGAVLNGLGDVHRLPDPPGVRAASRRRSG